MHVLMVAAENGALAGGKVGGLGDVIRDAPNALASKGHQVSVITPGYGILANPENSHKIADIDVLFCDRRETVSLFSVKAKNTQPHIQHWVLEHWLFAAGGVGAIYSNDHYGPFATDAHKFALFCAGVGQVLNARILQDIDVLHCHDWHSASLLILRQFSKNYLFLQSLHTVFSIHNLAIQGVRPIQGDDSSLLSWFPEINGDFEFITHPRDETLVNLMRAGINLADRVHTVSPTYAKEILLPSDPKRGFVGGEGLESDLSKVNQDRRLFGILNGCDYDLPQTPPLSRAKIFETIDQVLDQWAQSKSPNFKNYYFALRKLEQWKKIRKELNPVVASIARVTPQKFGLLKLNGEPSFVGKENDSTTFVLDELLLMIDPGVLIIFGNGDSDYEAFFTDAMARHKNFMYLCGYSDALAKALYQYCDLYFMPSMFEPCGISQMLAMREGTPCLVHAVGGLKDTVIPSLNGFTFEGLTTDEIVKQMLQQMEAAVNCFQNDSDKWHAFCQQASAARFLWGDSAEAYCQLLYNSNLPYA